MQEENKPKNFSIWNPLGIRLSGPVGGYALQSSRLEYYFLNSTNSS